MLDSRNLTASLLDELNRDQFADDVTARLLGRDGEKTGSAVIRAKEAGVFSGEAVAGALGELFPGRLATECLEVEGAAFTAGSDLVRLRGTFHRLLSVERTLLNYLTHLCGVATLTRRYVEAAAPHPVRVLATRKTLPGLKELQLQAVRAGGGFVHRRSLSDGILIKENHQSVVPAVELIRRARAVRSPLHRIEVEVQSLETLKELLEDPPEVIMLDNFTPAQIREAVSLVGGRAELEISGGVSLETIGELAALGVRYVSVGRLTHSAPAVDLSLDWERGHG